MTGEQGHPELAARPRIEFGTDGIRGEAGVVVTEQLAANFGAAVADVIPHSGVVLVGRDTRESGDGLTDATIAALIARGIQPIDCTVVPTPALSVIAKALSSDTFKVPAIVITASHNEYSDNGLKAFGPDGGKISDKDSKLIEDKLNSGIDASPVLDETERITQRDNGKHFINYYYSHLFEIAEKTLAERGQISPAAYLGGQTVVIDAANGAASFVAPHVFEQLGADVVAIASAPDGTNINKDCGVAHHIEKTCAAVLENKADVGISFDGDADRVMLVTPSGKVIDGDRIILIAALAAKKRGELPPNPKVVGTLMSNMGLEAALKDAGVELVRAKVGDRFVAEEMERTGAKIGGERSGHIILGEYSKTGDGLAAALHTLNCVNELGLTLDEAADLMQDYPQTLLPVDVPQEHKKAIEADEELKTRKAEIEDRLHQAGILGRVNVRASGTESVIRVMVEVPPEHPDLAASLAQELVQTVQGISHRIRIMRGN